MGVLACGTGHSAELDLGSLQSLAVDAESSPVPRGLVIGAVAIAYNPRYEAQSDSFLVVPGAVYFGKDLLYLGDRGRYYFYKKESGFAGFLYGRFRFGNLDPEDTPALAGMYQRKGELEAGIGANLVTPYALLTARMASDVTNVSNGHEALLWADFPMIAGRFLVMPGCGAIWRSSRLANYYFGGVSSGEATASRPAHDTGSTLSPMVSLVSTCRLGKSWIGALAFCMERFDTDIANSPIVGHADEFTVLTGVGYIW
ncbi:MAG: MipA/OmpV family protein [Thermodesulfobacteriota bacterium]